MTATTTDTTTTAATTTDTTTMNENNYITNMATMAATKTMDMETTYGQQ